MERKQQETLWAKCFHLIRIWPNKQTNNIIIKDELLFKIYPKNPNFVQIANQDP